MTTWGDKLGGKLGHSRLGVGQQVPPDAVPQDILVGYTGFRNGLMVGDRPGDVPIGFYTFAQDVETDRRDAVVRSPGVTLVEDSPFSLQWMFVQPSLEFQSALIAIAAPYIGVKEEAEFHWSDVGLDLSGTFWVAAAYADVLLFSNGFVGYARNFDSGVVETIVGMPGARTIFVAFGRVFVGGTVLGDEYNPMAVVWTGVTGDYHDFDGTGSGGELLINSVEQGDRIVASQILSYNLVAILCRRSLWMASRTGQLSTPAFFESRLTGVGCVSEPTAKTTEGGVTFLSDEGVRHFDGQTAEILSAPINAELLPIDFSNLHLYKALWDGDRGRYMLTTPTALYIYQFRTPEYPQAAWFKRTFAPTNIVAFAEQFLDPTWETVGEETWESASGEAWLEMGTPESNEPPRIFFAKGTQFGIQDEASTSNLGITTNPIFFPRPDKQPLVDNPDRVFLTKRLMLEYKGSGTLEFLAVSEGGEMKLAHTEILVASDVRRLLIIDLLDSSRAEGLGVRISAGFPTIYSLKQTLLDNGPILKDLAAEHLYDEASEIIFNEIDDGAILW